MRDAIPIKAGGDGAPENGSNHWQIATILSGVAVWCICHASEKSTGTHRPPGARGEKGDRGQSVPSVVNWIVERASYSVIPILSGGAEGPRLELRPLFEQFNAETG